MDFERRHDVYMDFVKNNSQSVASSIFWSQLRHDFATTFVGGKAEVTGWRGKIYDPRVGEYKKSKIQDKIFIFLSRLADVCSRKFLGMASGRVKYERIYNKLNCDAKLPKNSHLYSHPVLRVGENCAFHPHLIRMLSHFSQLYNYCKHFDNRDSVLEIGGGAGLLGIIFNSQFGVRYFIVDLPEMIGFSAAIIATYLPDAKMLLPNEIKDKDSFGDADFVFLLPNQLNIIPDNSMSLSMNIESFMEMKLSEITSYFELIQRAGKPNSLFFTVNRYEKVPGLGDTEKKSFFEYPWNKANQDVSIKVSPLHQGVKHHLMMQRLQRIIK